MRIRRSRQRIPGESGVLQQEDAFAAQPKCSHGEMVVLLQSMFTPRPKDDASVFERINVESPDGKPVIFEQLPAKAKETLAGLQMRVFPVLELNVADPRDAIPDHFQKARANTNDST